ncbi:MAG: hypothetical protein U0271_35010 [Polyangiaceae bacterium]
MLPHFRESGGGAISAAGGSYANDLIAGVGVHYTNRSSIGFSLSPEIGYSLEVGERPTFHAFNATLGLGLGLGGLVDLVYSPHLLVGTYGDRLGVGMRNMIGFHFFSGIFTIDLGHEFIESRGEFDNAFVGTLGLDPAVLITQLIQGASTW